VTNVAEVLVAAEKERDGHNEPHCNSIHSRVLLPISTVATPCA
jgi:hypothetical protein